ncbi:MAG TPA: carboxypeptidase-like regulatory domain-containing protein [Pyrinomonadaceae bacterium]|nr:carboxypeptidase-like regulatory domain-containing protein [Pyrinomonadaceae bacterium]
MTRKIFLALAVSLSLFGSATGLAQTGAAIQNRGHAPTRPDGLGRLDLRVADAQGRPIRGAQAKLSSQRSGGFFCETWNSSDANGVAVLPPLHVGKLKLVVKAAGYRTQTFDIAPSALSQPVRVTLARA